MSAIAIPVGIQFKHCQTSSFEAMDRAVRETYGVAVSASCGRDEFGTMTHHYYLKGTLVAVVVDTKERT